MKWKKKATLMGISLWAAMMMAGCGQTNIAYIDGERVAKESPQLTAIIEEGNTKLLEAEQEVENQIAQNGEAMSEEEIGKARERAQAQIAAVQQQYALQITQKLNSAIADIAKEKKLDAVLDSVESRPTVISGGVDITDEVIQKLQ